MEKETFEEEKSEKKAFMVCGAKLKNNETGETAICDNSIMEVKQAFRFVAKDKDKAPDEPGNLVPYEAYEVFRCVMCGSTTMKRFVGKVKEASKLAVGGIPPQFLNNMNRNQKRAYRKIFKG